MRIQIKLDSILFVIAAVFIAKNIHIHHHIVFDNEPMANVHMDEEDLEHYFEAEFDDFFIVEQYDM